MSRYLSGIVRASARPWGERSGLLRLARPDTLPIAPAVPGNGSPGARPGNRDAAGKPHDVELGSASVNLDRAPLAQAPQSKAVASKAIARSPVPPAAKPNATAKPNGPARRSPPGEALPAAAAVDDTRHHAVESLAAKRPKPTHKSGKHLEPQARVFDLTPMQASDTPVHTVRAAMPRLEEVVSSVRPPNLARGSPATEPTASIGIPSGPTPSLSSSGLGAGAHATGEALQARPAQAPPVDLIDGHGNPAPSFEPAASMRVTPTNSAAASVQIGTIEIQVIRRQPPSTTRTEPAAGRRPASPELLRFRLRS